MTQIKDTKEVNKAGDESLYYCAEQPTASAYEPLLIEEKQAEFITKTFLFCD